MNRVGKLGAGTRSERRGAAMKILVTAASRPVSTNEIA